MSDSAVQPLAAPLGGRPPGPAPRPALSRTCARRPTRISTTPIQSPGTDGARAHADDAAHTDDPIAGVVAPVSASPNPAVGEVPHLDQLHAQMISNLPVPVDKLLGKPPLPNQQTPQDYAHYIDTRAGTWKAAHDAGDAPGGPGPSPR